MGIDVEQIILNITPPDVDGQYNLIIEKNSNSKYGIKLKLDRFTNTKLDYSDNLTAPHQQKEIDDNKIDYIIKLFN